MELAPRAGFEPATPRLTAAAQDFVIKLYGILLNSEIKGFRRREAGPTCVRAAAASDCLTANLEEALGVPRR